MLAVISLYRYRYGEGTKINTMFFLSAVSGWLGAPFFIGVGIPAFMFALGLSGFGYGLYTRHLAE